LATVCKSTKTHAFTLHHKGRNASSNTTVIGKTEFRTFSTTCLVPALFAAAVLSTETLHGFIIRSYCLGSLIGIQCDCKVLFVGDSWFQSETGSIQMAEQTTIQIDLLKVMVALVGTALLILVSLFVAWLAYYRKTRRSFQGARCCVVGANKGIGRAVAETLARRGASSLVLVDVMGCLETSSALDTLGVEHITSYQCDITSAEQVEELVKKVCSEGFINLVVDCAGVVSGKGFADLSVSEFKRVVDVNLSGNFALLKGFLPAMLEKNQGCFVGVSSIMGLMGGAKLSDYCASKFGLVGLFEALRMELSQQYPGVSLVTVCPYAAKTGMFDGIFEGTRLTRLIRSVFPLLEAEDVAEAIVLAAERGTAIAVVPFFFGPLINVVRCLPNPLYEFVLTLMGGRNGMDAYRGRSNVWGASG
jgi:all-trans-retinol dehydrogenase (NAD+)